MKILVLFATLLFAQISTAQIVYGNAVQLQGRTLSPNSPSDGQVVGWNSTFAAWLPVTTGTGNGSVTRVQSGTGLTGGPITVSGTLNVDVGTAANKIVQLTNGAQYPAVDGFLITNLNALTALTGDVTASGHGSVAATVAKLQGVSIATTSPTSAQILTYNSTLSKWNPEAAAAGITALTGDVTAAGSGSVAATVAKIQSVAVSTTSPTSAQVLTYNSTLSKWNPQTASGGTPTLAVVQDSAPSAGIPTADVFTNMAILSLATGTWMIQGQIIEFNSGTLSTTLMQLAFTSSSAGSGTFGVDRNEIVPIVTAGTRNILALPPLIVTVGSGPQNWYFALNLATSTSGITTLGYKVQAVQIAP